MFSLPFFFGIKNKWYTLNGLFYGGSIPAEFGKLEKLWTLELFGNQLTGIFTFRLSGNDIVNCRICFDGIFVVHVFTALYAQVLSRRSLRIWKTCCNFSWTRISFKVPIPFLRNFLIKFNCNDFWVVVSAVCLPVWKRFCLFSWCFYAFYPRFRCGGNKGILTKYIAWSQNFSVNCFRPDENCSDKNTYGILFLLSLSPILFFFFWNVWNYWNCFPLFPAYSHPTSTNVP